MHKLRLFAVGFSAILNADVILKGPEQILHVYEDQGVVYAQPYQSANRPMRSAPLETYRASVLALHGLTINRDGFPMDIDSLSQELEKVARQSSGDNEGTALLTRLRKRQSVMLSAYERVISKVTASETFTLTDNGSFFDYQIFLIAFNTVSSPRLGQSGPYASWSGGEFAPGQIGQVVRRTEQLNWNKQDVECKRTQFQPNIGKIKEICGGSETSFSTEVQFQDGSETGGWTPHTEALRYSLNPGYENTVEILKVRVTCEFQIPRL